MEEKEKERESDIIRLSNELIYRRYLMNKDQIRKLFDDLSIPEYIVLQKAAAEEETSSIYSGKTYLKDLAARMQLTIRQVSKMVGILKDRGFLFWSHDGNGSEGTYVTITDSGKEMLRQKETVLKDYYEKVITGFGKDNLIQLLNLMRQLETVMSTEMEKMEMMNENEEFNE